jgi:hypothetical protein
MNSKRFTWAVFLGSLVGFALVGWRVMNVRQGDQNALVLFLGVFVTLVPLLWSLDRLQNRR